MMKIIKENKAFFIPYLILLVIAFYWIMTTSKLDQMKWINAFSNPGGFQFFYYITLSAEGTVWTVLICLLLFIRFDWAIIAILSVTISSLFTQFLKLSVFPDFLRPIAFFKDQPYHWELMNGLFMNEYNSFPSGHTTSAFASYTLIAIMVKNKKAGFLFITLAFLTGFSRPYLFQHFPEDVLAGAVIGSLSSVLIFYLMTSLFDKYPQKWYLRNLSNLSGR